MKLLVFVLDKVENLEPVLNKFEHIGIRGATILESKGMARALEKIRFLSDQASRLHADTLRDLMRCHEAKDVLTICELAIQATMERKESGRCVYRLTDYPEINPEMAKPLLLMRGENGPVYQWGKAPLL